MKKRIITKEDLDLLYKILRMNQKELHFFLEEELKKYYEPKRMDMNSKYIFCLGDEPILLLAHMDTVYDMDILSKKYFGYSDSDSDLILEGEEDFYEEEDDEIKEPDILIFHDQEQQTIWSPDGLGADDRAGVFMILKSLQSGLLPSVLFTTDEEIGGIGAEKFATVYRTLFKRTKIRYILELDRQGKNDCVFYSCVNKEFENYINSYGFITDTGTFSDISIICPKVEIAGVNISIGYYYEHSNREFLSLLQMFKNYDIINKMIKDSKKIKEPFIYVEEKIRSVSYAVKGKCSVCDAPLKKGEILSVKRVGYVCKECAKWF